MQVRSVRRVITTSQGDSEEDDPEEEWMTYSIEVGHFTSFQGFRLSRNRFLWEYPAPNLARVLGTSDRGLTGRSK